MVEDVGRNDVDDRPIPSFDPVSTYAVVDLVSQPAVELNTQVLADDALLLPHQVAAAQPLTGVGLDIEVVPGLGQPGPRDHQTAARLHRRPRSEPDARDREREGHFAAWSHPSLDRPSEGIDAAEQVRDCISSHDEVIESDGTPRADVLPEVRPGVGSADHGKT